MQISLKYTLSFILLLIAATSIFSKDNELWKEKVSQDLLWALEKGEKVSVLVYFHDQERFNIVPQGTKTQKGRAVFKNLRQSAENTQINLLSFLEKNNAKYKSFYIVNAVKVEGDFSMIKSIAQFEEVKIICLDSPIKIEKVRQEKQDFSSREALPEWGLQIIKADSVWELGIRGEGVVVGGQDTGYDWTHPAIQNKYRGYINENEADHNYNWHDAIHEISPLHNDSIVDPSNNPCGLDVDYPCDDHNHGTHTMGTMLGLDGDNIIGVAPNARWIGVRNMERGWGSPSTYLEGFEWFLAPTDLNDENPDPDMAPHVINNSWSCPVEEGCDESNWQYLEMAIDNLKNAGVVVVVSAGNDGNACGRISKPPSMYENSFAVGATKLVDTIDGEFIDVIAGYSGWGPVMIDGSNRLKPDISAPGSRVRSSIPGNKYSTSNGTSMAGPHIAGVVALVISAEPSLAGNVDAIEEIIQMTADPKTRMDSCGEYSANEIPNFIYGYGRVNALKAVQAALQYTQVEELENMEEKISVYPNPSSHSIKLEWKGNQATANIKIIDLEGRTYFFGNINNREALNINALPEGLYVIKVHLDQQIITTKFIKKRQ